MRWSLRRWADWSLQAKGLLLLTLPLLILLIALTSGYELGRQAASAEAEARRTLQVQSDLQQLHKLLAEATTGVHGYLLTGRDDFLAPYWMAESEIAPTLAKLGTLVRDATQRERLEDLEPLFRAGLARLETLRNSGRFAEPEALRSQLVGNKATLDELRELLVAMQVREAELVEQRTAAVAAALRRNLVMTWVSAFSTALVALFAAWLFYTSIVQRVQRIAANAERLVHDRPLEQLPPGTDELGQLTARLQAASALLAERVTEARNASRAKTDFLSRVSHELRTPLNAVLGFAQLLAEDSAEGSVARRNATQIVRAGQHLLDLINELLDISRIEAGQLSLAADRVPLHAVLTEARTLAEGLAKERGVTIEPIECVAELEVLGDRRRLLQVLLNLVTNAVKYNRSGGWVRLRAEPLANGTGRIEVIDNGWGFDPTQRPRLFQPFERLGAETRGVDGVGLGLAIAARLVAAMGGSIDARSRPNEGSTFLLTLPVAEAGGGPVSSAHARAAGAAPARTGEARARLALTIEDNVSNRALVEALVAKRPGWRLLAAGTAAEGIELAVRERPELVLLDLHLPDGSGEAVLERLRAEPGLATVRVVVLTADALPETEQRLRAAGAFDFLTKPLDVARFLSMLDRV